MTTGPKYPADGSTMVLWVPGAAGIAVKSSPEHAELTDMATVDLSCLIQSGGIDLGISQGQIEGGSVCSRFVDAANGRVKVAPSLTFWRNLQGVGHNEDTAYELFRNGDLGWLVIRVGIPYETAIAAGQKVTTIFCSAGEAIPAFPGGDTNADFKTNFALVSGDMFDQHATVSAS